MKRLVIGVVALLSCLQSAEAALVAHWELDGNGNDSVGSHDGTVQGATATEDRFGNANSALLFNGSNNYITVPHHADLNPTNAMTVMAWFKPNSFSLGSYSWPAILKKTNDTAQSGYSMEIGQVYEGTPKVNVIVSSAAGGVAPPNSNSVATGTWYFLAGVYEYNAGTSTLTTYFGHDSQVLESSTTTFDGQLNHSSENLNIGRDNWNTGSNRHFNGIIDDVRIYNEALTASQVNGLYIPEPSTLILLTMGAVGLLAYGWRRRRVTQP